MLSKQSIHDRQIIKRGLIAFTFGLTLLLCFSCTEEQTPTKVDLSNRVSNKLLQQIGEKQQFNFGIGSMITPKEGYSYYRQLIDYVADKMGQPARVIDRGTYDEINTLLEHQQIDIAFVCGGPYVEGKEKFGLDLLALPEMAHGPIYYSYLIVPAKSPARTLEDLRDKTFAFTDPKSNSGMIVPNYWLAKMGETPDSFFSKHILTYAHDASIQAVIDNLVDGAAVDSLIWEYLNSKNPEVGVKTRIIKKSDAFGIPPIVVRPNLPNDMRQKLQSILLVMHEDPEGKSILDGMLIRRFVRGNDSDFDTIRQMRNFVAQQNKGKI